MPALSFYIGTEYEKVQQTPYLVEETIPIVSDVQPQSDAIVNAPVVNTVSPSMTTDNGTTKTFTSYTYGYSIEYPHMFDSDTQKEASADFDGIDTSTMFFINYPSQNFVGTNVGRISVFAGAKNIDENACYNTIYGNTIAAPAEKTIVVKNGITYHLVAYSEAAAGSVYDTYRYSTMHNNLCYQIYAVAHSSNDITDYNQNNPNAPITKYDPKKLLLPIFNHMVDTLVFKK